MSQKQKVMRFVVAIVLLISISMGTVYAETTQTGSVELIVSTILDLKLESDYSLKIPMLAGEGPLTSGNNLKLKALLGVSPVAATLALDAVLTPVAVMELSLGGSLGTGWDSIMNKKGLMISVDGTGAETSASLDGAYYNGRAGAAFQFDTAAIFPGDWTSVVLRSYHELSYQGFTFADGNDYWEYELSGYRKNGIFYRSESILGYQMPIMLNMVAVMLETGRYHLFDSTSTDSIVLDLSIIGNLAFTDNLNLTIIGQFGNKHTDDTTRAVTGGSWAFKRVVGMLKYSF